ncbi:MAG: TolC family protein, partial [Alphaproteobacteria bacterium]|nr:TolC family protein [Alphaproteobacteria bacterium]
LLGVGAAPEGLTLPVSAAAALPATIDDALGLAASNSPTLKLNRADVETAQAEYKAADSRFYPKLNLELSGRTGENLDGEDSGRDSELRAQLVMRYNLYNGGIDVANRQEQMHRQVESEKKLASARRDVEELMRNAWNTLERAREQTALLERQERVSSELLASYQAEYKVGRRALLDILDAQNELIITRIDLSTSRHALLLAEFRVLAVAGKLMEHLNVAVPAEALPVSAEK